VVSEISNFTGANLNQPFPPPPGEALSLGRKSPDRELFASFFLGGFECSSKLRLDGKRLDLSESTGHARLFEYDYRALTKHGIRAARDGFRWHLVQESARGYDWSSIAPMLQAARDNDVQIVWDLCHYGWPDWLDIWSPEFISAFARYAAEAADLVCRTSGAGGFYCVINEISFWAWAGGKMALFAPAAHEKGPQLKRQLASAAIAATRAIKRVDVQARFISAEPVIQVTPRTRSPEDVLAAEDSRLSQFEALDMLLGNRAPELGGGPELIDVIGLNYYPDNQWYFEGSFIPLGHFAYRPFRSMLTEVYLRYRRPLFIAETGAEGSARAAWLHYVASETAAARHEGIPVEGLCIYPILDYPGWYDERHCAAGLFSLPGSTDERYADRDLAAELRRQQLLMSGAD
jgi:beta-glucosidase/6-phospho-beta-glucosidase/beta-galactosidase